MTARGNNRGRFGTRSPLGGNGADPAPIGQVPVPSILDGRRYEIRDSGDPGNPAWVERTRTGTTGRMQVPFGATEADRRVRLHEMAHVRWTPAAPDLPEGVSFQTLNAVEDRRIHKRLDEIGLGGPLAHPILDEDAWAKLDRAFEIHADEDDDRRPMSDLDVARLHVAAGGTAEAWRFTEAVRSNGRGWILPLVDEIIDRCKVVSRRPAWKRSLEAAAEIDALFRELDDLPVPMRGLLPEYTGGQGEWGEMTIHEMDLSVAMPRGLRDRVRRATDTGAIPRNWHRVPIDGAVFTRSVRRPAGGTVLMDQSGSMSLDPDEIQALMAAYPGVTVATYAGSGGGGQLRIIARNGRRASDRDCVHPMNGNVIDGPALDWLCNQPGPRIWISDGYVTGAGDNQMGPNLLVEANQKVRAGRIIRVDRMGDLMQDAGGPA